MSTAQKLRKARIRRHHRVRKNVRGSADRPRLAVFRSNKHITAQVIDDVTGKHPRRRLEHRGRAARRPRPATRTPRPKVGALVAERAKAAGVSKVVFDRGGFQYHGRVAAVADAARENGLEF